MSFVGDITFHVYHGGNWVSNHSIELAYTSVEVLTVECKAVDLFTVLATKFSLYDTKIWYKFPFEDCKDRKRLCFGDSEFSKMCEGSRWTGVVDVFVVDTRNHPEDDVQNSEPCEEELRVEQYAKAFADVDEESFDYHDTPPNSDGEEEEGLPYVRYKKGSGELKLSQGFDSLKEFKDAVIDYVLEEKWNIKMQKTGREKNSAFCGVGGGCQWRIYCSYEKSNAKWMVKTFEDEHTCNKDGRSKIIKGGVIAKLFLNDIRCDPDMGPKAIQNQVQSRYNLISSYEQCKKAKSKALKIIKDEQDHQFSRFKNYKTELLRSNPGSTVELDTFFLDDGSEVFQRFYVCFEALKKTWKLYCRPIFGIDGCFMKSNIKGQILAAVGRDANNGMYPIAWAVVDVENEPNWVWFIQLLKADLDLKDGSGITIISDRQKGLLNAVKYELPCVEHRMCARHIYGNLKKQFPNRSEMKKVFWRVAESYTKPQYEVCLGLVKEYDMSVYEAMMQRNPQNCSLAFFGEHSSCVDVHNNISESYNNAIDPSRYMPMVEMLETIRRGTMIRISERLKKAMSYNGRFTKRAGDMLAEEQKMLKFCSMVPGPDGRFEVLECKKGHSVDLIGRSCVCRRWQMSGIPCRHALRAIAEKKLCNEDYIAHWYANSRQEQIYRASIEPVNTYFFWNNDGTLIKPPPSLMEETAERPGRKPKPKRTKPRHESPTKKTKVPRTLRVMHCRNCGQPGHNILRCPLNPSNTNKPRRKSKKRQEVGSNDAEPSQSQSMSQSQPIGASQQSEG